MTDPSNSDRADWALLGLQAFTDRVFHSEGDRDLSSPEAFDQAVGDFLGDLMHYVNEELKGATWTVWREWLGPDDVPQALARLLERGRSYYEEELAEELAEIEENECQACIPQADAPDCSSCGASNAGDRVHPHLCEVCNGSRP